MRLDERDRSGSRSPYNRWLLYNRQTARRAAGFAMAASAALPRPFGSRVRCSSTRGCWQRLIGSKATVVARDRLRWRAQRKARCELNSVP